MLARFGAGRGLALLLVLALSGASFAQEPGQADPSEQALGWRLQEKEQKKLEKLLAGYLRPGKKTRLEMLEPLQKLVDVAVEGHSPLEDVQTFSDIASGCRVFNPKCGKKGRVEAIDLPPEVHGFPGGTVRYHLYLPKQYDDRRLWPLLFCMPDNKKWRDGSEYIERIWTQANPAIADGFVVVVPTPQSVGEPWHDRDSWARAMIALRHVCGNFDSEKDDGGPAVDMNRVFVDGEDMAAQAAARFPELFAGAVLRHSDGTASGGANLREVGGIAGLPAYCVVHPKRAVEQRFAEALSAANPACRIEAVEEKDAPGDAGRIHEWIAALPPRDAQPREIRYWVHGPAYQRHFWINVLDFDGSVKPAAEFHAVADREKNEVRIETTGVTRFELFLNDALLDLGKEVRVVVVEDGKEYEFLKLVPTRDLGTMLQELVDSNHPWRIYPVRLLVDVPALKQRLAQEEAAQAAKKGEPADASVGK